MPQSLGPMKNNQASYTFSQLKNVKPSSKKNTKKKTPKLFNSLLCRLFIYTNLFLNVVSEYEKIFARSQN